MKTLIQMKEEYNALVAGIDPTSEDADTQLDAAEALKGEIELSEKREERVRTAVKFAPSAPVKMTGGGKELSAAEYLSTYFNNYRRDPEQFSNDTALYFEDQYTADNPAFVPENIVGNLIEFINSSRPVFSSFNQLPMPDSGKTFERPYITQHVAVGEQAAEGDPLVSQKMQVATETVSKRVFGGQLTLSYQNIRWTDPAMLQVVVNDFVKVYSRVTEQAAVDFLSEATLTTTGWTASSIQSRVQSLVEAIVEVDEASDGRYRADTVWMDPGTWASLAYTHNTNTDTSALTLIRQSLGDYGYSLNFVPVRNWSVAHATPAVNTEIIVGDSEAVEAYEKRWGLLQADEIGTLEKVVAYAGELAFYIVEEGFAKLV